MCKYKYIFWDLDGTITDTSEGIWNCINYCMEKYGFHIAEKKDVREFIGPPLRDSLPLHFGLSMEETEEAIATYRERYVPVGVYECELFPGVREAMECFRKAGCIQVLTSSKPENMCHQVLGKFDLEDALNEVVGASWDGKIDTKLEVLNEAFRRIKQVDPGFEKSQVVLLGDTKYDAMGAKEAGIACIGVGYGFGTKEELLEHGAIKVCDTLKDITTDLIGEV